MSNNSSGIGISGLLGVSFVVLKLTHYIDWRWRWVLAPFWIPLFVILPIVLILLFILFVLKESHK